MPQGLAGFGLNIAEDEVVDVTADESVNDEAYLKPAAAMARLFSDLPKAVTETVRLAERLEFTLEDLGYEFPRYPVGPGETMEGVLKSSNKVIIEQGQNGQGVVPYLPLNDLGKRPVSTSSQSGGQQ